jgi:G3E family GTPase
MTKIDIFSGFLGAGKTTLIKKLLGEAYSGEKLVLIENEFGQIGIDGGFLREAGVEITEMNSGCICCSLVGDFREALAKVIRDFSPDRILIEPSGVGKLSDVIRAVQSADTEGAVLGGFTTVVDAKKAKMYMKNFGEFFNDQVTCAGCIVLSHTQDLNDEKIAACVEMLREKNPTAVIVTTPWDQLDGKQILAATERRETMEEQLAALQAEAEHHHHHHHHDHDECDDPDCCCHHHDHDHGHHHHHHADDVFTSWGAETTKKFDEQGIRQALETMEENAHTYGTVLRAKGIVAATDGSWLHFDYVPGEIDIRRGAADIIGRLCVIGSKLDKAAVAALFGV